MLFESERVKGGKKSETLTKLIKALWKYTISTIHKQLLNSNEGYTFVKMSSTRVFLSRLFPFNHCNDKKHSNGSSANNLFSSNEFYNNNFKWIQSSTQTESKRERKKETKFLELRINTLAIFPYNCEVRDSC